MLLHNYQNNVNLLYCINDIHIDLEDQFETIKKFGEDYEYERFVGEIKNQKVTGLICLEDENIYNLKELS